MVEALRAHGAAIWVFDVNREFTNLPTAGAIRVGENFTLSLAEVGFGFLMAVIRDIGPMTEATAGAFQNLGPRFMNDEIKKTGFATLEYLEERAGHNGFHNHEMVNRAIEGRLRAVRRTGLFSASAGSETLGDRFWRITAEGGRRFRPGGAAA
jgi:hypothetical protein